MSRARLICFWPSWSSDNTSVFEATFGDDRTVNNLDLSRMLER
jgi:hypothetical protein